MWVLALRMKANQTSPLISLSIAEVLNIEADFASCTFYDNQGQPLTLQTFVLLFNNKFQPKTPYTGVSLSPKIVLKLINEMQTKPSRIESWLRLPHNVSNIEHIVSNTTKQQTPTPTSARL